MAVINGKVYDWSSVAIKLSGLELEVQEISYDDELEKELAYGMGSMPRGYGVGNYKAEGKLSLLRDDYHDLLEYCKKKGVGLYKLVIPTIVINYAHDYQRTKTDVLNTVTFTKASTKNAQGDKALTIDLDMLIVGTIERDGVKPI